MHGYYTKAQLQSVVSGVQYGREMLRKAGLHPTVFAEAFAQLGALQIPGETTGTATRRRLMRLVLQALDSTEFLFDVQALSQSELATVKREIKRALNETLWVTVETASELVGFRIECDGLVDDPAACEKHLIACDHVTIGHGIWHKSSIAVLPACFDAARFAPLFEHQTTLDVAAPKKVTALTPEELLQRLARLT